jgi:ubiquinone/menaquinone biosynthesis C-methylase UbiE
MTVLRLNLGCGNKLYPNENGWVNVDIVSPETPVENFLLADLKDLWGVQDDSVDEIHAFHIIEHFFRDEIQPLLKEWLRVLKPGGVIALEQPDVIKCAANFLEGLASSNPTLGHNLGILGFYGDGSTKAPYMGHKWGWYPQSLANELHKAGFVQITQAPAQTHAKDQRDFRLEARKATE